MRFGITMGDSSGVGPEILLKAFRDRQIAHPVVAYGDGEALAYYNDLLGYGVELRRIANLSECRPGPLNVLDAGLMSRADVTPGRLSRKSGQAAREYVIAATRAALAGEIAALVTLPMNKEATQLSDPKFTGHTELIGELCGAQDVTIMLASEELVVTHVTTHCSLAEAIALVKKERIFTILRLTCDAVGRLRKNPRIAVAGLNPHAGESGLFGDEEIREIAPAVADARAEGIEATGPLPPDTVFARQKAGEFDAVVAMVHDHGHIAVKTVGFRPGSRGRMRAPRPEGPAWRPTRLGLATGGVNLTLGLPIIRTSVDHGTAFEIAGKGIADPTSMVDAITLAAEMAGG